MALFILGGLLAATLVSPARGTGQGIGVLGGPEESRGIPGDNRGALVSLPGVSTALAGGVGEVAAPRSEVFLSEGLLRGGDSPLGAGRSGMVAYSVGGGDTLPSIAARFGVSIPSITGLNPDLRGRLPRAGELLTIPPVSGILHEVGDGETIEAIASEYGVALAEIRTRNRNIDLAALTPGMAVFIPGALPLPTAVSRGALPNLAGYFTAPADGFNWGRLHSYNAIDIANRCGTPIRAAAGGLVTDISRSDWGGGYGHFLVLEHSNGTRTKYAHLDELNVDLGDYIRQGAVIAAMGKTGEATGCHLHFEVVGAKNPFARE